MIMSLTATRIAISHVALFDAFAGLSSINKENTSPSTGTATIKM